MDGIMNNVTGILMAIIGVAILYTLVSPRNQTSQVIRAGAGGFSQALATAMGGSTVGAGVYGS